MIIVLNGPPGCGKDTIAMRMAEASSSFKVASIKEPMFDIARALLGSSGYKRFMELYNCRETKERTFEFLGGYSPRGFLIHLSEDFCKPTFGDTYFGQRLLQRVKGLSPKNVVISDGGFPHELVPVLEEGHTIMLVRLHRDGYTFAGDSRDYIYGRQIPGEHLWELDYTLEDGEVDKAVTEIIEYYKVLLEVCW